MCYMLVAYDTDLDIDYPDCATGLSFALEWLKQVWELEENSCPKL